MNLVFAGPCGVGKSAVAKSLANRANLEYLDFDALGIADMQKRKGQVSPFSMNGLNFKQSLPIILSTPSTAFILDIGGSTVFRKNADNNERLAQILWLKKNYTSRIVVLTATKDILLGRFTSTKKRNENEFDEIRENWLDIAEPYWQQCGDIFIDTSFLTIYEITGQIETKINRSAGQHE